MWLPIGDTENLTFPEMSGKRCRNGKKKGDLMNIQWFILVLMSNAEPFTKVTGMIKP
jgi:hypothetical protein